MLFFWIWKPSWKSGYWSLSQMICINKLVILLTAHNEEKKEMEARWACSCHDIEHFVPYINLDGKYFTLTDLFFLHGNNMDWKHKHSLMLLCNFIFFFCLLFFFVSVNLVNIDKFHNLKKLEFNAVFIL